MNINRLSNIVNPFPESFTDNTGFDGSGGRSGLNYDYNNERNKWILEGIHDSFINYGAFPEIGLEITAGGPVSAQYNSITLEDAMAYAALYPQNAVVVRLEQPKISGYPITQFDFSPLSREQAISTLQQVYERVSQDLAANAIFTMSDISVYKEGAENLNYLKMPSILYQSSQTRTTSIRKSFKLNPLEPVLGTLLEPSQAIENNIETKQRDDLDFLDWTKNLKPSQPQSVVYYNSRDGFLYYLFRSRQRDINAFDIRFENDGEFLARKRTFLKKAFSKMLAFAEIDYVPEENRRDFINRIQFLTKYGDNYRSPAPNGISVWLLGAKVLFSEIKELKNFTFSSIPEQEEPLNEGNQAGKSAKDSKIKNKKNKQKQTGVPYESYLSPYQISKKLLENNSVNKGIVYQIKNLEPALFQTEKVIKNYSDAIARAKVSPSMIAGFNINNEVQNFSLTNRAVQKFISVNGLPNENYDMIEFRMSPEFEIRYAFYNGQLILDGLGLSKTNLLKDNTSENAFMELSNTSLAYFYYSTELSTFAGRKDIPPWTTFLSQYTYPSLNENSLFKSKISRYANTGGEITSLQLSSIRKLMQDGDRKQSASQKMANAAGDTKMFPSEQDIRTIRAKKDFISEKELENAVRSAIGSCDTGLSTALSEAFQIYDLVTSRADKKAVIAGIVRKSMDGILFLQKKYASEMLTEAEKILSGEKVFEFGRFRIDANNVPEYINRPDFLGQEIERELYRQVSCIFDLIGDGINQLVLDPLIDEPGPLKTLVRDVVNETDKASKPYTIDFLRYKVTTRDTQASWRLAIEKIIESFLKQMILSIFKDVVTALLGCGPEEKENRETQNNNKFLEAYGELRINLLLENSDKQVRLLEICENLDIKNTILTGDNLDQVTIEPATLEQLYQFHEDVSDSCTRSEAEGLLEGNAPRDLVVDLVDMTTDNIDVSEYNNFLTNEQKTILIQASNENNFNYAEPSSVVFTMLAKNAGFKFTEDRRAQGIDDNSRIRLKMSADSLSANDVRYATLDFTEQKLREYFREIGKELGPDSLPSSPLVPEDAFCDPKLLASRGTEGIGVSLQQLGLEVRQGTDAELEKLLDLCELFNGAFDGFDKQWFDKWEEGLPIAEGYRLLLEKIAFLSRLFQSLISDALGFSAEAADTPVTRSRTDVADTQLYQIMDNNFGEQKVLPKVRMVPNRTDQNKDDVFQWYIAAGIDQTFSVDFEIRGNTVFLKGRRPDFAGIGEEFVDESLGTFELNTDNGMGLDKGTLRGYIKEDGLLNDASYSGILDSYNAEIATTVNTLIANAISRVNDVEGRFPLVIASNASIRHLVTQFYITDGDRLRNLSYAISEPLFLTNGDPCVLTQQERIAIACLNSIQTRITSFVLNVAVFFPATFWNFYTADIIDMVAAYLTKKFEYEMTDKKMFDIYLKAMDDVDKVFSKGPVNSAGVSFDISTVPDLRDKFNLAIKFCLETIFINIEKKGSNYRNAGRNPYDVDQSDGSATTLLNYLRTGEVLLGDRTVSIEGYNPESSLAGFTDGENERPAVAPTVAAYQNDGSFDGRNELLWTQKYGYYYMPISLIHGMTLIFYDYAVNAQGRLPNFKFFSEKRVANADDTLLTAINPENVTSFSDRFSGYPLTVGGVTYYSDEEVLKNIKIYQRQYEDYERYLNILKTPLFTGGSNSYNFLSYKGGRQAYTILGEPNEIRVLQLGNLEFNHPGAENNEDGDGRDFFNPLYGMYVPIFRQLPIEEQDFWIKVALKYSYTDAQMKSWFDLEDSMGTPEQRANPNTQKAFAFYERKRVMEIAGDFLQLYRRSYSTFLGYNPYAPVAQRTRDGKLKIQEWVAKERLEALVENQSDEDGIKGVHRSYGTANPQANLAVINYPQPGQWGISRGKLVLDQAYLRRGGGPAPYSAQGYRSVTLEEDITSFFRYLNSRPSADIGGTRNDLEKVAINHLYYTLSSLTQRNIQNINPDDPESSINVLKRHLGIGE